MIKEAIEKIEAMSAPTFKEIGDRTFCIQPGKDPGELRPELDYPGPIELSSLDGLVKMVKTEALQTPPSKPIYLQASSPMEVQCFAQPVATLRDVRPLLYTAKAVDVPGWNEKTEMRFDEAIIALRTRFQPTKDTEYALMLLSDITCGAHVTYNDNGIAQTVVTKTGVALQQNAQIRPIISLRPYRTFQEVEQPASDFLIRIGERGITFIEADGGMWKLAARQTVKAYLEEALETEIKNGEVVVML
jgi:hypothetical protein